MNDIPQNDRALELVAARLAAHAPRLPQPEQDQLLYQCAFAAGQAAARKRTRRWQALSAALAMALVGLNIAWQSPVIAPAAPELANHQPPQVRPEREPEYDRAVEGVEPRAFDAWQVAADPLATLSEQIAKARQADPADRLLSVGGMNSSTGIP